MPDDVKIRDEEKEVKVVEKDETKIIKKLKEDGKEKRTKTA